MKLKFFIFGLLLSFGLPWFVIIALPYAKMRAVETVEFDEILDEKTGVYQPKTAGTVTNGAIVYAENGCYICHTQVVRPTYAGADVWRSDWGSRETNVYDFLGESYAQIGLTRNGPDLSNFGSRVREYLSDPNQRFKATSPEQWVYNHLLNPKEMNDPNSYCPPLGFLFKKASEYGQERKDSLINKDGDTVTPTAEAKFLAGYLMSLQRDGEVPAVIDYSPKSAAK